MNSYVQSMFYGRKRHALYFKIREIFRKNPRTAFRVSDFMSMFRIDYITAYRRLETLRNERYVFYISMHRSHNGLFVANMERFKRCSDSE